MWSKTYELFLFSEEVDMAGGEGAGSVCRLGVVARSVRKCVKFIFENRLQMASLDLN